MPWAVSAFTGGPHHASIVSSRPATTGQGRLGFRFAGTELSEGGLAGVRLSEPFFQEFVFHSPVPEAMTLRVALVANPVGVDAVLSTVDGHRFQLTVRHDEESRNLATVIGGWDVLRRAGNFGGL